MLLRLFRFPRAVLHGAHLDRFYLKRIESEGSVRHVYISPIAFTAAVSTAAGTNSATNR
jgi:hypothetical protein